MKVALFAGAVIQSVVFGSLHAFSVLVLPLQVAFETTRARVSLGYALAVGALTVGVYCSRYAMRHLSPAALAAVGSMGAAVGLGLAASGMGLVPLLVGYGLVFGFANGLIYSLFLDRAAQALPTSRGISMGLVTATYAGGAALFAPLLGTIQAHSSVFAALALLALTVLLCGLFAAYLFSGSKFESPPQGDAAPHLPVGWLVIMWAVYLFGVSGGLMTLGHAAPLMTTRFPGSALAPLAVMLVAGGNILGSVGGGLWAQKSPAKRALAAPVGLCAVSLAALLFSSDPRTALLAIFAIGAAYGGLIAAVPIVIVRVLGSHGFAKAFGVIFSAWGLAGLLGPSIAGLVFDHNGSYNFALLLALFSSLIGLALTKTLPVLKEKSSA
jgi:MFS transporter, OFA family, oxalate/formate antiporter